MEFDERQMHLRAGAAYGKEATCGRKIRYGTEKTAAAVAEAMTVKYNRMLEEYPCYWCGDWHIGRTMTEAERKEYS